MDKTTKEALEASIQHWRENLAAEAPETAETYGCSCALCRKFAENRGRGACQNCPVHERTGFKHCERTPYRKAHLALDRWRFTESSIDRDAFRIAAKAEIEFLESLR